MRYIKPFLSVVTGLYTFLFGKWDPIVTALLLLVIIDYVTGIISAAVKHELNSSKGFNGILKKVFIFLIVGVACILDKVLPAANGAICASVCMFYIANESLSIIENAGEIGIPLPKVIRDTVEKLK